MSRPFARERGAASTAPVTRASPATYAAILIAALILVYLLRAILLPFVVAGIIAYVVSPLVEGACRRLFLPRWAAVALVYLAIIALLTVAMSLILPPLIVETRETVMHLPQMLERAIAGVTGGGRVVVLGQETDAAGLTQQALTQLRQHLGTGSILSTLALGSFASISGAILTLVLLLFFMASGSTLAESVFALVPPQQRPLARRLWRQVDPVLIRYFGGVAIVVFYTTAAAYLGLRFGLHLQNALVLAIVTGFLELVPMIGPLLSALIAGAASLRTATELAPVLAYGVYVFVLRLSIDQMVGPLVLGRAGKVSPVLIIFCFLAGGALFGIVGVILAVPFALSIRVVLATLYDEPLDGQAPDEGARLHQIG